MAPLLYLSGVNIDFDDSPPLDTIATQKLSNLTTGFIWYIPFGNAYTYKYLIYYIDL